MVALLALMWSISVFWLSWLVSGVVVSPGKTKDERRRKIANIILFAFVHVMITAILFCEIVQYRQV